MSKLISTTSVLTLIIGATIFNSCGTSIETKEVATNDSTTKSIHVSGDDIFMSNGCVACHQADIKTVGPSLMDISAAYNNDSESLSSFLKEESEPIIDPAQAAVMKPQLTTTKALPPDELSALVDYLLSH